MKIQQSAEDYLETILMLSYRKPMIRSIDVVNELGYSKPSVSVAMKNLRENGYISMDHEGYITLEPSGRKIAEMIYERHTLLTKLLVALDVPREVAVEDACRIEHGRGLLGGLPREKRHLQRNPAHHVHARQLIEQLFEHSRHEKASRLREAFLMSLLWLICMGKWL